MASCARQVSVVRCRKVDQQFNVGILSVGQFPPIAAVRRYPWRVTAVAFLSNIDRIAVLCYQYYSSFGSPRFCIWCWTFHSDVWTAVWIETLQYACSQEGEMQGETVHGRIIQSQREIFVWKYLFGCDALGFLVIQICDFGDSFILNSHLHWLLSPEEVEQCSHHTILSHLTAVHFIWYEINNMNIP